MEEILWPQLKQTLRMSKHKVCSCLPPLRAAPASAVAAIELCAPAYRIARLIAVGACATKNLGPIILRGLPNVLSLLLFRVLHPVCCDAQCCFCPSLRRR